MIPTIATEQPLTALEVTEPHNLGLSSTRLARISQRMQQHIDEQTLPGLLTMIVRRGQVGYLECFGMMDVANKRPIGSFGWDGGDGTRFWVDPTEEMIGIIMAQSLGTSWVAQDQFPILTYQAIDD